MHYDHDDMREAYLHGLWQGAFAGFFVTVLTVLIAGYLLAP